MDRDAPKVDELTPIQHARYERAVDAVYRMGWGDPKLSLTVAADEAGTSAKEVLRLVGRAFKREGRCWKLRHPNQWPRGLDMITRHGFVQTMVRSPKAADRVASHYDAIRLLLKSHDASALRALEGKFIVDGYGVRRYFCTDPATIRQTIKVHRLRIGTMNGHWFFTEYE